jgi:hypothetical protein
VTATATQTVTSTRSDTATSSEAATPTTSPSETPTSSATPAAGESGSSDSLWWVWLLVAVAVGAIVWFVLAAARHRKWDAAFANELLEARWAADTLMPSVTDRSASAEEVAQRWSRGQPRLNDLQMRLTRLVDTAAGSRRAGRIAHVSGATTALGQALASDVALRSGTTLPAASEADLMESRSLAQTRSDALLDAIEDRTGSGEPQATGPTSPGQHER